ncbi:caspase family protein [Candidatus Nitronereus thalassa]|uniref:Caspase family protein n=1 Tax=Candidatus Nitronereus thalassa TaxID=3020898 RepID=A0ABU3KAB6_9BACT|nr:caspase family protein [Candidatus Nitronereus thalassa]MDT7043409.1 caspase family protein [Candidatus Nitronereus thalassa]
MSRHSVVLRTILGLTAIYTLFGCNSVNMPELAIPELNMPNIGFGEKAEPPLQISVAYAFDPSVTQATLEVDACGLPYTINSGEIIPQAFLAIGKEKFASVAAFSGSGQAVQASQQNDLTIHLQLINQSFQPATKMAQEDTYIAFVNLQMLAIFMDSTGNQVAQTPLNYSAQASLWTPALTSSSVSCVTSSFDDEISRGAGELARQLVAVVPQAMGQNAPQPVTAQATTPGQNSIRTQTLPALKFRTMLKDGNNNLILEGGEALALQIEATNSGAQTLSGVNIELEGSPTLLKAFSELTPSPILFGDFQSGETKTTEIRGRMPFQISETKGELIVTLKPSNGSIVGSHRIVTALQSANPSGGQVPPVQGATTPAPKSSSNKYVALLIGLDQYREKWPKAYKVQKRQLQGLKDTLRTTGLFSDDNIRVLQGSHATRTDIEEALLSWGRQRLGKDSVLIFHFSGQALSHPTTGEVYLVPFEGSPTASAKRLISLRTLQRVLGKMENRLTLLILDTPVTSLLRQAGSVGPNGSIPIKWASGLPLSSQEGTKVIQIRHNPRGRNDGPAEILAGLLGRADANGNGTITLAEFLDDVKSKSEITSPPPKQSPEALIPLAQ